MGDLRGLGGGVFFCLGAGWFSVLALCGCGLFGGSAFLGVARGIRGLAQEDVFRVLPERIGGHFQVLVQVPAFGGFRKVDLPLD